jgi:hypothetical protein
MGASVVRRDHFDVLVRDLALVALVLKPGVWEVDRAVEVGQVLLASLRRNLFRTAVRTPVAVGAPAVGLLQELLVVAFQFVVEYNAPDRCPALMKALLRPQVSAVDPARRGSTPAVS